MPQHESASETYANHNIAMRLLSDTLRNSSAMARMCERYGFAVDDASDLGPIHQLSRWLDDQLSTLQLLQASGDSASVMRLLALLRQHGYRPFEDGFESALAFIDEQLQEYADLKRALERAGIYQ